MFTVEIFRVLFITNYVDDKLMLCKHIKPTLHGYNKLARDKVHDILWPCKSLVKM